MTQTKEKMNPLPQVTPPASPGATTNLGASGLALPSMAAIGTAKVGNYFGSARGSSLLGALGSGVMNLVSGAINRRWQKQDYERQRQDALADYQMQREDYLSDLADERAYNSPSAQRARLLQAGINPNTVFGNGSVSNTSSPASNVAQMRGSDMSSPGRLGSLGSDMVDAIMPTMNVSLSDLQAENMREDVAIKKANVLKMLSETRGIDASTKARMIENGYLDLMLSTELNERKANVDRIVSQLKTDELTRAQMTFDLQNLSPAKVNQINASISHTWKEIERMSYYLQFDKDYERYRAADLRSSVQLKNAQKYETETRSLINSLEAQLKEIGLPKDKVDYYIQGCITRLQMITDALSPIDF